jgi:mycothiol system anti-sigma-R factor
MNHQRGGAKKLLKNPWLVVDAKGIEERDSMTCEEAVKRLYEYLDHELDNTTITQVEKHLDLCRMCCDHMEFEKRMKKLVQECCFKQKAPEFLKEKITESLSDPE